jgi:hypothetical protein
VDRQKGQLSFRPDKAPIISNAAGTGNRLEKLEPFVAILYRGQVHLQWKWCCMGEGSVFSWRGYSIICFGLSSIIPWDYFLGNLVQRVLSVDEHRPKSSASLQHSTVNRRRAEGELS